MMVGLGKKLGREKIVLKVEGQGGRSSCFGGWRGGVKGLEMGI